MLWLDWGSVMDKCEGEGHHASTIAPNSASTNRVDRPRSWPALTRSRAVSSILRFLEFEFHLESTLGLASGTILFDNVTKVGELPLDCKLASICFVSF